MYRLIIACLLALSLLPSSVEAKSLTLASDGKAQYNIVSPSRSTPAERLAASELARYLRAMCAADFPIAHKRSGPSIIVCQRQAVPQITLSIKLPTLHPEGYALLIRDGDLYVVGADKRGVLYAVYDVMHRLGCRFLAPDFDFYNSAHEYIPEKETLRLSLKADVIEKPVLKFRKLYVEEGLSHNTKNLLQMIEWMPRNGFNTLVIPIDYQGEGRVKWDNWREALTPELQRRGIIIEVGGHGYQNFLNAKMQEGKLFKEHPDWFGMDEKGQRTKSIRRVFNTSSEKACAFLEKGVLEYLATHLEIDIFDFWPPDSVRWSQDKDSKAQGTPTDRMVLLTSQVAKAIQEKMPRVRVECIAYASYIKPPPRAQLDPCVLVDFCPICQSFETLIYQPGSKWNELYAASLQRWLAEHRGDISIYSYYRKYAWRSLPNLIPHYMQKELQYYRDAGADGISSYAEPGDWFTYELNHYVLGALAWNPDCDVDNIIDEFCQARYGKAAKTARRALMTLADNVRIYSSIPFTKLKNATEYDASIAEIEEARVKVAEAKEKHTGQPALQAHLLKLELMLEYARRDILLQQHRAAKGPKQERRAMVEELHSFLEAHKDEGLFLLHYRLSLKRMLRQYAAE
jgi:Domain of unknown function (DUF4838)/Glycosyl hydrolase family 67 N-terminus